MGNIIDFINWRGDITFDERPFTEVDNLILCEMAYAHIEEVMAQDASISVAEAGRRYFEKTDHPDYTLGIDTLRAACAAPRYQRLIIRNLETYLDEKTQFGAMCIDIAPGITCIIFRGTDESISGWREDFAISFRVTIAQELAAEYLNKHITDDGRKYMVMGHSKGGNLAVYAAMVLPKEKQDAIIQIYSNDGPGIPKEQKDEEAYGRIRDKIVRYVPTYCVVGKLFELDVPATVVKSTGDDINQHNATTWQVTRSGFVEADEITHECQLTNNIFHDWIESVDMAERKAFTIEFFHALELGGKETMIQFHKDGIRGLFGVALSTVKFTGPAKKAIAKLVKSATKNTIAMGTARISSLFDDDDDADDIPKITVD